MAEEAGRRRALGARSLQEDEHYAPWEGGNKNKDPIPSNLVVKRETKILSRKGIDSENVEEFVLEEKYNSDNYMITKKNNDIIKKLNSMRVQRIQWLEAIADGASKQEVQVSVTNMSNLKRHILRLQQGVAADGGIFVPIPNIFKWVPI